MNPIANQLLTPLLTGNSVPEKREQLKQYFINTWQSYEALFALINDYQAYYLRPEPLRHPLIFYFGHTASFFINKLLLAKFINHRINEKLEAICAVGVDEMSWDDLNKDHYDWPSVEEVTLYRQQVFQRILALIETMELSLPIQQNSIAWVILMGCEHERIHLETSSVLIRQLDISYISDQQNWPSCTQINTAPNNEFLPVKGEEIYLGKKNQDHTFGWDNEYGSAKITVPDFQATKYLITNQEFLAFVEDGGYLKSELWTEEGRQWLAFTQATMPRFWLKCDINTEVKHQGNTEGYHFVQRNLTEEIPLPLSWPVEVNYLEAKAYCNWQSKKTNSIIRLLTEAEWYLLKQNDKAASPTANNNLAYFASSCSVNFFNNEKFNDVSGNVWQWTESVIDAFPGFDVHPLYDDFSTPTFDGRHNIIKGGSWISTGNEIINSSRYAFRRHFTQHAGFRIVKTDQQEMPLLELNVFETNRDICQQLASHYGENSLNNESYPKKIANVIKQFITNNANNQLKTKRILDLGCSVGRCSFELATDFHSVDAVDFSAAYIQHGVKLQQTNKLRYALEKEGDIVDYHEVDLKTYNLSDSAHKVKFSQGDLSNLKTQFSHYDVILVQHALEQSYDAKSFLQTVHQRLNVHGLLVIVSDYQFNEQTTDKSNWLSGIKVNGENILGIDGLLLHLSQQFTLLTTIELTRVIKINQRNYHVSKPELTIWQLK